MINSSPDLQSKAVNQRVKALFWEQDHSKQPHLLIGITGSVACIKLKLLVQALIQTYQIAIVATQSLMRDDSTSIQTFSEQQIRLKFIEISLLFVEECWQYLGSVGVPVFMDIDERQWKQMGDRVLHIDLMKWAHTLIIAPISANSIAKMAAGISDNLLLLIWRAWPYDKTRQLTEEIRQSQYQPAKPILIFPAMNPLMYEHPLTQNHLNTLKAFGIKIFGPVDSGRPLACGDTGIGAMMPITNIAHIVRSLFTLTK